jgi:hypothetical protein
MYFEKNRQWSGKMIIRISRINVDDFCVGVQNNVFILCVILNLQKNIKIQFAFNTAK